MSVEAQPDNGQGDNHARIAALETALAEAARCAEALNRIADAIGCGRDADAIVQAVVDERRLTEAALAESEARFALLADGIPTLCWMADPDGRVFWFNRRWHDYTGLPPGEAEGWKWKATVDPGILPQVVEHWQDALETGQPVEMVFPLRGADGAFRPFLTRVTPSHGPDGQVTRWFGVNIDIEEINRAQERQRLLLNELNHRVKNTLATVQSIAFQTLRSARSPSEFRTAFEARLMALSQTHNLLTDQGWHAASLRDILLGELEPYGIEDSRVRIDVDRDVKLGANAAVSLGMGIHELVTNAAKYGALSTPRGGIDIRWRVEQKGEPELAPTWREEGGPSVSAPERRGFGARLLEQGLAGELSGKVQLDYDERGLRCTMRLPMRCLEPAE